mgnify:CR=1 FL=1
MQLVAENGGASLRSTVEILAARELQPGKARIETALFHKFLMRASGDDTAFVHYHDPVGPKHCRKPVCDDERRAVSH